MNKTWNYIKNNKLKSIFNFVLILIFSLPYCSTGSVPNEESDYIWKTNFVLTDMELLIFYLIIVALTIFYQSIPPSSKRNTIIIILLIICLINSLGNLASSAIPTQDYMPDFGNLLAVTLGPIMLLIVIMEFKENKKTVANTI